MYFTLFELGVNSFEPEHSSDEAWGYLTNGYINI
jgi:hypothetical protein